MNKSEKNNYQHNQKQFPLEDFSDPSKNNFATRFIFTALDDITAMFNKIFGETYIPKNNFGIQQKEKIINYLIFKNLADHSILQETPSQKFFKNNIYPQPENLKQEMRITKLKLKDDKSKLQQVKVFNTKNRIIYVNQVIYEYNRMRYVSMAYGCVLGSALALVWLRKSTSIRKAALAITCTHLFGQYSVYSNMNLIFDKLYPLFKIDLQNQIKEYKKGNSNEDITNMMKILNS